MAQSPSQQEHRKSMAMTMTVPQLLTPEEPLADNFALKTPVQALQPAVPSPPASPEFNAYSGKTRFEQSDDVLYPEHNPSDNPESQRPLFESSARWPTPERQHSPSTEDSLSVATPSTRNNSPQPKGEQLSKPRLSGRRDDQTEIVGPVALNNYYGVDWYRFCVSQNQTFLDYKMAQRTLPPLASTKPAVRDGYTEKVVSSLGRPFRVQKPASRGTISTRPKTPRVTVPKAPTRIDASTALPRNDSQAKRSRRQTSTPDASFGAFSNIAQPKPRTRAAPSKKVDDKGASDWRQIPDYCPPLNSLDKMSEKLVVQWTNSNELDLKDDPDRDQLHPQELKVASTLRLKCNQYLANKRRIFQARTTALRDGRDFNKTSAQTSTNIDVNKASRLWAAFDNVGWFDEKWFQQFLQGVHRHSAT